MSKEALGLGVNTASIIYIIVIAVIVTCRIAVTGGKAYGYKQYTR